jgi:hypothetical protein
MTLITGRLFLLMSIKGKESQQQWNWECSVVIQKEGGDSLWFLVSEMNTENSWLRSKCMYLSSDHNTEAF